MWRVTRALVRGYWLAALLGALLGLVVIVLAAVFASGVGLVLAVVMGAIVAAVGAAIAVAFATYRDLLRIPANSFGICSGLGGPSPPALTPWLADLLDDLAGRPTDGALLPSAISIPPAFILR